MGHLDADHCGSYVHCIYAWSRFIADARAISAIKTSDKDYLLTIVLSKLTLSFKIWLGKLWGLSMLAVIHGNMT